MKGWDKFYDGVRYIFRNGVMKIRYEFCDGTVKEETPGAEYENTYKEAVCAELRNNAKEDYYRHKLQLAVMNDKDVELEAAGANPEEIYIASVEAQERKKKVDAVLETLTPEQSEVVKLLRQGLTVSEIARLKNIAQPSVWQMRERIQKRFREFL